MPVEIIIILVVMGVGCVYALLSLIYNIHFKPESTIGYTWVHKDDIERIDSFLYQMKTHPHEFKQINWMECKMKTNPENVDNSKNKKKLDKPENVDGKMY